MLGILIGLDVTIGVGMFCLLRIVARRTSLPNRLSLSFLSIVAVNILITIIGLIRLLN